MSTGSFFTWSDLHIGHVKLSVSWRPWAGGTVESHNAYIRDHWNSIVRPGDTVRIVGDACMGVLTESLEFVKTLHGTKELIGGNHDRFSASYVHECKQKPEKTEKFRSMYAEVFTLMPEVVEDDQFIWCHFPWFGTGDHNDRDLINRFGPKMFETDKVLIHGHTHSPERYSERAIHVGVDAWRDGPVDVDRLRIDPR